MAVRKNGSGPESVVLDAIRRREEARKALLDFEAEHEEVVNELASLYEAQRQREEEVKTAMASAALNNDAKVMEFVADYKTIRPVFRVVDVPTLLGKKPSLLKTHPQIFDVKAKNLDEMVNGGELEATIRNEVVKEELGTPRCYIPAYK
jgi:hypothetical protein